MAKTTKDLDFEKPFAERYFACADAISQLEHWLMVVGMENNRNFDRLRRDFIDHGAETFRDINRCPQDCAND